MITMDNIRDLAERIIQTYHPQQVILFGSYAHGTPTADSDVDLLVILPLAWNDFFLREVMEKGRVLYEAPHP